jgi:putative PIN family toxin of toxin-antitoxin system
VKQTLVFDTNILISGYLWTGKPRQAIRVVKSGGFRLLYCRESIDELIRVLSIKFGLDSGEIFRIVSDIHTIGKKTTMVTKDQPISEDITDNLFINLAIDRDARLIVSGDSHLLKLKEYKQIGIITVFEFLKRYL